MHKFAFFNTQILPAEDIFIPAFSSASLYGKGIFTTIAVCDGKPFLWEKHWRRLLAGSSKLNIDLSHFSEHFVRNSFGEIIKENTLENGRARITVFDGSAASFWQVNNIQKTSLLITTADMREIHSSFKLNISPYLTNTTSPLAGIKSCNYFERIAALNKAKESGFDEAVCLNERGDTTSAVMANLFWRKDGKLFTPSLKTGCVAGTTREYLLENEECVEVEHGLEMLHSAEAVFLTSAGIGIVPAEEIDGRKLNTGPDPILDLLPRIK